MKKRKQNINERINVFLTNTIYKCYQNNFDTLSVNERLNINAQLHDLTKEASEANKRNTQKRLRSNKDLLNNIINSDYYLLSDGGINARRILNIIEGRAQSQKCYNADLMFIIKLLTNKMIYGKHELKYASRIRYHINELFNKIDVEAIQTKHQSYNGTGITTTSYLSTHEAQERHDYHAHPNTGSKEQAEAGQKDGETLIGFEGEGAFPTRQDFNAFCSEAKKIDFEGGKLYDERNFFMPTYDCSIRGGYTCEFGFCPMSVSFAKKFYNKFIELLKKHKGESSTEINNAGTHAHIDADKFNQETLKNLYNIVYGESDEQKLQRYERENNEYCSGNKQDAIRHANHYIKQAAKGHGKDIYTNEPIIRANSRYALVNFANAFYEEDEEGNTDYNKLKGTIELRGWNAKKTPLDVIDDIVYFVNKAKGVISCVE